MEPQFLREYSGDRYPTRVLSRGTDRHDVGCCGQGPYTQVLSGFCEVSASVEHLGKGSGFSGELGRRAGVPGLWL